MGIVQVIIDDTASKVITGTYDFARTDGGVLIPPAGTAFPSTPVAGELFWRTDLSGLYRRNDANTTWVALSGGGGTSVLVQTAFAQVTSDTTTTSTSFIDLLTINVTTGANHLIVRASAHASNGSVNAVGAFRITVDGSSVIGGSWRQDTSGTAMAACSLQHRTSPLTATSHVVKLQWRVWGGTARIRPVVAAEYESASLLVEEVTL